MAADSIILVDYADSMAKKEKRYSNFQSNEAESCKGEVGGVKLGSFQAILYPRKIDGLS